MTHLALIMDGNGRWATKRNLPRIKGHEQGARALLRAIDAIETCDIEYTSFYAFSTDNKKRDSEEVANILGIIAYFLEHHIAEIIRKRNYRVRFIGELNLLAPPLIDIINSISNSALNNKGRMLIFAIGYGGDEEIVNALNLIIKRKNMRLDDSPVTIDDLTNALYTVNIPNPDMVIRYGGHKRLSNFMPVQTIYSELLFLDKMWPDFDENDLRDAISEFHNIKRNFGGNQ